MYVGKVVIIKNPEKAVLVGHGLVSVNGGNAVTQVEVYPDVADETPTQGAVVIEWVDRHWESMIVVWEL